MNIIKQIDAQISALEKRRHKPEHIIMGKNLAMQWLVEMSRQGQIEFHNTKKFRLNHRGIPVVVCESEILEVVPNARYLLG